MDIESIKWYISEVLVKIKRLFKPKRYCPKCGIKMVYTDAKYKKDEEYGAFEILQCPECKSFIYNP